MNTKYFYKKVKSSLLLIVAVFFAASCESYLDEQPSTLIDLGYVYNTEEGLKSGIVSLYKFNRDRLGTEYGSLYFWKHFYNISNKATGLINAAEVIEGVDEDSKNKIIAEAKFFRAYAYFYLYRMYKNIYVTTETVTVDNAFDLIEDKSSETEIFALLNSDLNFAIEHLDWNVQFGRVSKGTAKHIKAKVAMWEGNWDEAKTQALSVIEDPESPFRLVESTGDVFKGDRNTTEQLFTVQSQLDVLGGGNTTMLNANYVTQYFQISGIESNNEQGGQGFSRVLPNRYLLDLLAEDENDTRDDNTYFRLKYYYTSGANVGEEIDIYKPITEENPEGDDYLNYYKRLHPSCIKFAQEDSPNPASYFQQTNIVVYRLAETYLIAAEALMRSGGDGLPYLNEIRERANATPIETLTLQAIMDENARELSFEGERFFFLKRLGSDILNHQMTTYAGDGEYYPRFVGGDQDVRLNWQPHFINFPIFQEDLDLLGPNYPQNDLY